MEERRGRVVSGVLVSQRFYPGFQSLPPTCPSQRTGDGGFGSGGGTEVRVFQDIRPQTHLPRSDGKDSRGVRFRFREGTL